MQHRGAEPILQVKELKKYFKLRRGIFSPDVVCKAVDGVNLHIECGEILGLIGESGSGKTTLARCILRLLEPTAGEIYFRGQDVLKLKKSELKELRRQMQMIFQDPYGSLDGRMTVGEILAEPLIIHRAVERRRVRESVSELLELVGLSPKDSDRYPHEFSGGQRQRIAIARAIALKPKLIVADEPFSALDVSVQGQIANLLLDLKERFDLSYLFISHDLAVVWNVCDRVAVMYRGRIVETGPTREVFAAPRHDYTRSLIAAAM